MMEVERNSIEIPLKDTDEVSQKLFKLSNGIMILFLVTFFVVRSNYGLGWRFLRNSRNLKKLRGSMYNI